MRVQRSFFTAALVAASLVALGAAAEPAKPAASKKPLEVTYYYLPG
jgi:hypothetical protein